MDERTIQTYNQFAKDYDAEVAPFWELFPRTFLELFASKVHGSILDVGAGPGRDGLILQKAGHDIVCVDASESMVAICKERGLPAVKADFLHLPFDNESFSGVWSYTALLHIPKSDFPSALLEIHRVLKAGGIFALGLIEGDTEGYRETSEIPQPRWFSYYVKEELEKILTEQGFNIIYFEERQPKLKKYLQFIMEKVR